MAFKMKGFNPGKGNGMGSAFHQNEKKMMRTLTDNRKLETFERRNVLKHWNGSKESMRIFIIKN